MGAKRLGFRAVFSAQFLIALLCHYRNAAGAFPPYVLGRLWHRLP